MDAVDARTVIAEVWRREAAKIIAVLTRVVRDVGLAEELAQDALVAALSTWPRDGVPDRPGAWLLTTARNRALNTLRRRKVSDRVHGTMATMAEDDPHDARLAEVQAAIDRLDEAVDDDVLRLMFIACHPILSKESRVALTLRLLGGLTTEEIARAFLAAESAVAQRIVRAKRTLAEAGVAFELPPAAELGPRLASVLEVVYLIFNEGYVATAGDEVMRPALQGEALRLGSMLAALAPAEPEVHGLCALMSLQASRAAARTDARGEPVLLLDQDRGRWDRAAIARGLAALEAAEALGGPPGPYRLQARIAACHARATTADATEWPAIAAIYGELAALCPSPVIELNLAIAVSRAEGPAAGLDRLDRLAAEPSLARYHLVPSARADLLERLGRREEARAEFERAAALTDNARQRRRLLERAAACADHDDPDA